MADQITSQITGNQRRSETAATKMHEEAIKERTRTLSKVAIGGLIVSLAIYFAGYDVWEKLLLAIVVWFGANRLESAKGTTASGTINDIVWYWPSVLKTLIGLMLLSMLIASSVGRMAERGFERIIEGRQPAYSATGTNWLMNPITGKVFKTEPQDGCKKLKNCFDPYYSDGVGGTDLIPYDKSKISTVTPAGIQKSIYTPPPPPLTEARPGQKCGGAFKNLKGCESILFGRNEKRDHEPPIGFCSAGDGPITKQSLGGGVTRWLPNAENVVGRVFSLKVGDSYGGATCGKP